MAIFPAVHQSLPDSRRSSRFSSNTALADSAETCVALRFCRSCTRIYRIIQEMHGRRADHGSASGLDGRLRSSSPVCVRRRSNARSCSRRRKAISRRRSHECPAACPRISGQPVRRAPADARAGGPPLSEDEATFKYKARRLRDTLDANRPEKRLMDQIERLCDNSIATRIRSSAPTFGWWSRLPSGTSVRRKNFELVSDGNVSLIRAAEKFDVSLG